MSAPTMQVLVGFQSTTGFGSPFLLDNATYGVLNTAGRGTLGGVTMVDLTNLVMSVNITRGRSRQLDQFNSGSATIAFDNASQVLNPTNTSSPYYPFVLPRCPVQILANGISIYTGLITDWNLDYAISNEDTMYASCSDQFTVLANQALNSVAPTAQTTGARINTVLSYAEINYQGARAIDTGSSTLGGGVAYLIAQDTNCLNYLQLINTSEQGYLFMSGNGTLTFKGRSSVLNPVAGATFNTTGTGIGYQTLMNQYGDELLYNYIVTQSPAGAAQTTSNSTSISLYQTQNYNLLNLLNSTTTEVAALGNYLLGKYQNPVLRFTGLSTQMAGLTAENQNICLNLDLTSICTVVKNFVVGTPSTETQTLIVSGISHNITPGNHVISYTFESTDGNQYLTLNDTIFGTLDNNLLSF
jgi:hypothetical protein